MKTIVILYPLLAMVLLTFVVGLGMVLLRVNAVRAGKLKLSYFRINTGEVPKAITRISQNYDNLLALPMLFYVLVILLLLTKHVTLTILVLAWLFVLLRVMHSFIHITYNNVVHRATVWTVSVLVLLVMWLMFFGVVITTGVL